MYTRSDLNKIREETIKKYDLIEGSSKSRESLKIPYFLE